MINYSIIIPHKNIPKLLKRCINSIPYRNDTEILIIDDNSDPEIVDFDNFPCCENSKVRIIFTKEGLGAGFARNIGLKMARGKWLIFADSDDYFLTDNLSEMMDYYMDSLADIIYFNIECLYADTLEHAPNADYQYKKYIEHEDAENLCRYQLKVPWGKFVKRQLVECNGIKFDETKVANDIIFSIKTGILASMVKVSKVPIYVWLVRQGSLTTMKNRESALLHFDAAVRYNEIVSYASLNCYRKNLFESVPNLLRSSFKYKEIIRLLYKNTSKKYLLIDLVKALFKYIIK